MIVDWFSGPDGISGLFFYLLAFIRWCIRLGVLFGTGQSNGSKHKRVSSLHTARSCNLVCSIEIPPVCDIYWASVFISCVIKTGEMCERILSILFGGWNSAISSWSVCIFILVLSCVGGAGSDLSYVSCTPSWQDSFTVEWDVQTFYWLDCIRHANVIS